ncbi:hypothetical protein PS15p_209114 [Mucor circinelloides]
MLINGEKWACETCIKGHRATHCKHTDRKLISIKKKGRPATQCKRCRELRVLRQLHVKCDCDDSGVGATKKNSSSNSSPSISSVPKKRKKVESLRPLAPKLLETKGCCNSSKPLSLSSSPSTPTPSTPTTPMAHVTPEPASSCCSKKSTVTSAPSSDIAASPFIPTEIGSSPSALPLEPVPLPDIPPPTSCCGPPSKNQQGETIRVVTCRCGDSCACIGCDAHPSRAMKEGKNDVYIGFDTSLNTSSKRRLSIAAICTTSSPATTTTTKIYTQPTTSQQQDHPSSILAEDGTVLCGCGCSRAFADCSDCFRELCDGYFN